MNFQEQPPVQEQELQKGPYESMIYDFLGEAKQYLSIEDVEKIAQDIAVFEAQLIIDEKRHCFTPNLQRTRTIRQNRTLRVHQQKKIHPCEENQVNLIMVQELERRKGQVQGIKDQ